MEKHKHMDTRFQIERGLNNSLSFKTIAAGVGKDCTTISKEVRAHPIFQKAGAPYRPFNDYKKRLGCIHRGDLCSECLAKSSRRCSF